MNVYRIAATADMAVASGKVTALTLNGRWNSRCDL